MGPANQISSAIKHQTKNDAECAEYAANAGGIVAFDFTEKQQWDNCRLFKAGMYRYNEPGADNRRYCLVGTTFPVQVYDQGVCIVEGRFSTLESCYSDFDGPDTCKSGCNIDGTSTPRNYMCVHHTKDEPTGAGSNQLYHGICLGSPDTPTVSALCKVVDAACSALFSLLGSAITSAGACTLGAAEIAGICEAVGLGPEDPFADICAVVLGGGFEAACLAAVSAGKSFGVSSCDAVAGC